MRSDTTGAETIACCSFWYDGTGPTKFQNTIALMRELFPEKSSVCSVHHCWKAPEWVWRRDVRTTSVTGALLLVASCYD